MEIACLSRNSLLQACAQKAIKAPELLLGFPLSVSTLLQGPATGIGGQLGGRGSLLLCPFFLCTFQDCDLLNLQREGREVGNGVTGTNFLQRS